RPTDPLHTLLAFTTLFRSQRDLRCQRSPLPIVAGDPSHDQGSTQVTMLSVTINGRAYGPREVRDELSMNDFLREYLGMTGTKFGDRKSTRLNSSHGSISYA